MAFGMASLAVAEVAELVRDQLPASSTRELLVELETAHRRLRDPFDHGDDTAVHALALSVLVLADPDDGCVPRGQGSTWHMTRSGPTLSDGSPVTPAGLPSGGVGERN